MSSNLIRAGVTREGFIEPVEGLHDGLTFTYQPMLAEDVEELDEVINKRPGKQGVQDMAAVVAKHVKSWSEVDEKKQPVPINFDTTRALPYFLFFKLVGILKGRVPNDIPAKDRAPSEQAKSDLMVELEAIKRGQDPGQAVVESIRKN